MEFGCFYVSPGENSWLFSHDSCQGNQADHTKQLWCVVGAVQSVAMATQTVWVTGVSTYCTLFTHLPHGPACYFTKLILLVKTNPW